MAGDRYIGNRAINILLLVVMFVFGCSLEKLSPSQILEIKPLEERIEDKYKKLRNSEALTMETEISSRIFISRTSPYYSVKYLKANLKLIPVTDSRQKVLNLEIKAPGTFIDNTLAFTLDDPSPGFHEFKVKAETLCRYEYVRVTDKISWPFQVTAAEHIKYTEPSLIIDSDDENIHALASSITKGKDDLYRIVFKASKWVMENVHTEFDNSTVYTSQKASWVLENREGVCDEKTNLLIGLLRSLGIPAKFITGFVGINYNHKIIFKPHSWTEVYFPSVGWIPFDVAYKQLGFIDATHIKVAESVDTSDPITSYEWETVDISDHNATDGRDPGADLVSIKNLRVKTKIKQEAGTVAPLLESTAKVWHNEIEAGSYNVIEATVINPNKFYVITDLHVKIPYELKIMGKTNKMLLLEPDTKITVYWIVKPTYDPGLNMFATFPVDIIATKSNPIGVSFNVTKGKGNAKYSLENLKRKVEKKLKNERNKEDI